MDLRYSSRAQRNMDMPLRYSPTLKCSSARFSRIFATRSLYSSSGGLVAAGSWAIGAKSAAMPSTINDRTMDVLLGCLCYNVAKGRLVPGDYSEQGRPHHASRIT